MPWSICTPPAFPSESLCFRPPSEVDNADEIGFVLVNVDNLQAWYFSSYEFDSKMAGICIRYVFISLERGSKNRIYQSRRVDTRANEIKTGDKYGLRAVREIESAIRTYAREHSSECLGRDKETNLVGRENGTCYLLNFTEKGIIYSILNC